MERTPILLVEDQPDDQFLTIRTLKKLKMNNISIAHEGEEALNFLRQGVDFEDDRELPGLIIVDLRMPKIDGFEFLEALRADNRMNHIPVFVLSSSPQVKDRHCCLELGVKAYLTKPLEATAFKHALQTIT
jgi:CheY-like chemotaxis protein